MVFFRMVILTNFRHSGIAVVLAQGVCGFGDMQELNNEIGFLWVHQSG